MDHWCRRIWNHHFALARRDTWNKMMQITSSKINVWQNISIKMCNWEEQDFFFLYFTTKNRSNYTYTNSKACVHFFLSLAAETHSLSHSQGHSLTSLCWHKMHKKCMHHKKEASHLALSPSSLPCHWCCAWATHTTLISAVPLMCTHVTASIRASGISAAFCSAGSRSSSGTNRKVCHF